MEFLADLNAAGVIPTREYLGFALIEEGDWNQDLVFAKFDVIIEPQNQRAYAAAYAKMMSAAAEDVGLRSWGNDLVGFGTTCSPTGVSGRRESDAARSNPASAIRPSRLRDLCQRDCGHAGEREYDQLQFLKAYPRQD
ncbi:MAG: hypothetical protein CM15mP103_01450 [Gammaproteobacteria bacterium]|nr:MAG: hypothetical protein CM15mP103_01450 [Gammaproteobacteria bacterium]